MIREELFAIGLSETAVTALCAAYEQAGKGDAFRKAQRLLLRNHEAAELLCRAVAEETGISVYTVCGALVASLIPNFRGICREMNIPEEIATDTLRDFRAKNEECMARYGVWGTFVLSWYARLMAGKILKIGRLEYEEGKWGTEGQSDYLPWVRKKERVWKVHIPSGEAFSEEAVMQSLRSAYDFFGVGETKKKTMAVTCASWLLSPRMLPLLKEGSNLRRFAELFDVYYDRDDNEDLWRIFGVMPNEQADNVPTDTSLRRGIAEMLKNGKSMGFGRGILIFDGEKIVNK